MSLFIKLIQHIDQPTSYALLFVQWSTTTQQQKNGVPGYPIPSWDLVASKPVMSVSRPGGPDPN